jgi:hypothetical protein
MFGMPTGEVLKVADTDMDFNSFASFERGFKSTDPKFPSTAGMITITACAGGATVRSAKPEIRQAAAAWRS